MRHAGTRTSLPARRDSALRGIGPFLALALLGATALAQEPAPDVLATLRAEHPRLLLDDARLAELRRQHGTDATLQRYVADVLKAADAALKLPALRYEKRGPRLLHVSRAAVDRIYRLALAWRWTKEERYAERAVATMREVCAFPDWNPSHFLDTAEMSHAVGIGYDWLFAHLDDETRRAIRDGLVRHGLEPGLACWGKRQAWWTKSAFNWNQVCNCGLAIGALAIAETDPRYARTLVAHAVESLPIALRSYAPDGAWMEGPGYWDYATRYTAYGLAAFESALGTDFGLGDTPGLAAAGFFPILTAGPTGLFFNFADCSERAARRPSPCLLWLAQRFQEPRFADADHALLANRPAEPHHVIWYRAPAGSKLEPESRFFRGKVVVAVLSGHGTGTDRLWVATKGGYNQVNHGHLDLGSFVMDALGERWAVDLGSDDYNLPRYWEDKEGGRRWSYYRLGSRSHNVVLVDDRHQRANGTARVRSFAAEKGHVVLDLGPAYAPAAKTALRGLALVDDGRAVLVQDELELPEAHALTWGMTTAARIELQGDGSALLRAGKATLEARVLAPAAARFTVASAEQKPPEKSNRGVSRLLVTLPAAAGAQRIAVLLAPRFEGGASAAPELRPLADW